MKLPCSGCLALELLVTYGNGVHSIHTWSTLIIHGPSNWKCQAVIEPRIFFMQLVCVAANHLLMPPFYCSSPWGSSTCNCSESPSYMGVTHADLKAESPKMQTTNIDLCPKPAVSMQASRCLSLQLSQSHAT